MYVHFVSLLKDILLLIATKSSLNSIAMLHHLPSRKPESDFQKKLSPVSEFVKH